MSDDTTPRPEPSPPAESPQQPETKPAAAGNRRLDNKAWLLITAAALLFGCFVGAGAMAVGSFVAGHAFHGRDRVVVNHAPGGDQRGDQRRQPQPPNRRQPGIPRFPNQPGQPTRPNLPPSVVPSPS